MIGQSINQVILRGDPCCWNHWISGEGYLKDRGVKAPKLSELPRWAITRRPWIEFGSY